MKVVYKTVLDKIENELSLPRNDGENIIKYFSLTPTEFKELISDYRFQANAVTQLMMSAFSFPLEICGQCITELEGSRKRCVVYHKYGVDWLIVEENS